MKKILAALLALASSVALGATLNPVQLLNPTGSTSGQTIVSAGSSSAPNWGNVSATALTGILPVANGGTGIGSLTQFNVLVGNGTSAVSTISPGSAGNLLTSNGTGSNPSFQPFSSGSITGVTNGSNAAAGIVGEYISSTSSSTGISSSTPSTVTSITLTAGDWDVYGNIIFTNAAGTTATQVLSGISTTNNALPAAPLYSQRVTVSVPSGGAWTESPPSQRINVSTSTQVFLVGEYFFSGSTATVQGIISARRRR